MTTAAALLYGIVQFDGAERHVRQLVIAFESARAADLFAIENGYPSADYMIAPITFVVDLMGPRSYGNGG